MPCRIQRASSIDLGELANDVGPVPLQVGAILVFEPGTQLEVDRVRDALADRIRGVARLRQRLRSTPPGCGRPVWVDDARFDITGHVHHVRCLAPGDDDALLRVAARVVTDPLPADQPLWSATLVTGLAGDTCALIVVFHHVLADGMGGLAVLANIVDGGISLPAADFPRPKPSWRVLARDAASDRLHTLRRLSGVSSRLRDALGELRHGSVPRAPRCSLNRPVGCRRHFGVAHADLDQVRAVGHNHRATVNDVVLVAVGGALSAVLAHRGERVDSVVVSVPVAGRTKASASGLGNQVGVMVVEVPTSGGQLDRLGQIAEITRLHKAGTRGASATLLAPAFRALAALGVLRWLNEHQHLITTFVSNLRGPDTPMSFLGATISEVVPLTSVSGNVAVAFAVLSYAGTLVVTVIVDVDAIPDSDILVGALQDELDSLTLGVDSARALIPRSILRSMAKSPNSMRTTPNTAISG